MSIDPQELLFKLAHKLRPEELGHLSINKLRSRRAQNALGLPNFFEILRFSPSGRISVGNLTWDDLDEIDFVDRRISMYRPPGYGRFLVAALQFSRIVVFRFIEERWYYLGARGPKFLPARVSAACLRLKPLPRGPKRWIPVPEAARVLKVVTLLADGTIAIASPDFVCLPARAASSMVTPRGDLLRKPGSDVTIIGEPLVRRETKYRKRLRCFAYRQGVWLELVSSIDDVGLQSAAKSEDVFIKR